MVVNTDDLGKKRANFRSFKLSTQGAALYQQWGSQTSRRFHQAANNLNAFLKTGTCGKLILSFNIELPSTKLTELYSAVFHEQFLQWAGLPLPDLNRNRTGGAGINPGSDSEDRNASTRARARPSADEEDDDSFVDAQGESFASTPSPQSRRDPPASRMNQADNIFADIDRATEEFNKLNINSESMKTFSIEMEKIKPRGDHRNPRTLFATLMIPEGGVDNGTPDMTLQPNQQDVECGYVLGRPYTNSDNYIAPEMIGNDDLVDKFTGALDLIFKGLANSDKCLPSKGMVRLKGKAKNNAFGGLVDPYELKLTNTHCNDKRRRIFMRSHPKYERDGKKVAACVIFIGFFWAEREGDRWDRSEYVARDWTEDQPQPEPSPRAKRSRGFFGGLF